MNNKAFTLIEVLIVVFIISLLASSFSIVSINYLTKQKSKNEVNKLVYYILGKKIDSFVYRTSFVLKTKDGCLLIEGGNESNKFCFKSFKVDVEGDKINNNSIKLYNGLFSGGRILLGNAFLINLKEDGRIYVEKR